MKKIYIIVPVLVLCLIFLKSTAQTEFEMHEGETIKFDNKGGIVKTSTYNEAASKIVPDKIEAKLTVKNSGYNDDGTLKIPGYTPTGNKVVDEQNYTKAKYLLFKNNPEEYKKWSERKDMDLIIKVSFEEFNKMPDGKKQMILSQPKKYYIDMSTEYKECE